MDNAVALAAITLAGTIATGFFALLAKLSRSMDRLTDSNVRIADEAKERNGHLAKLTERNIKLTSRVLQEVDRPVHVQTVETQVVKEVK